jgi:chemotaxis protein MotB
MIKRIFLPLFLSILFNIISCVPPQQYTTLQNKHTKCKSVRDSLKWQNEKLHVENTELKAGLNNTSRTMEDLKADSAFLDSSLTSLKKKYNALLNKYDDLNESQQALIRGSARETKKLISQLQKTQEGLQEKEDRLKKMDREIEQKTRNLEMVRAEMEKQKARLIELENMLSRKDSLVNAIKDKVTDALLGFEGEGLTITQKNGKVYISMQEKLLFGTGSSEIASDGVEALKKLGRVLEKNKDINVVVEGHTDDQPFVSPKGNIKDNWDLSVHRATAVIRILLKNSNINPSRLTAAGRSKYVPVVNAQTPEARRKNRRTEIILAPDLGELYELLNK